MRVDTWGRSHYQQGAIFSHYACFILSCYYAVHHPPVLALASFGEARGKAPSAKWGGCIFVSVGCGHKRVDVQFGVAQSQPRSAGRSGEGPTFSFTHPEGRGPLIAGMLLFLPVTSRCCHMDVAPHTYLARCEILGPGAGEIVHWQCTGGGDAAGYFAMSTKDAPHHF